MTAFPHLCLPKFATIRVTVSVIFPRETFFAIMALILFTAVHRFDVAYSILSTSEGGITCFTDEWLLAEMDRPNMCNQLGFPYEASEMIASDPSTKESLAAPIGYFYYQRFYGFGKSGVFRFCPFVDLGTRGIERLPLWSRRWALHG